MNTPITTFRLSIVLLIACTYAQWAGAQGVTTWTGANAGVDTNWSDAANWTTSGGSTPPGTTDNVIFGNGAFPASTNVQGTVDSVVNQNFTIGGLSYTNITGNYHTTQINPGQTLTVNGTVSVGFASSSATTTTVNMAGTNCNFTVNNASGAFNVEGSGAQEENATLTLADGTNTIIEKTLSVGETASNNGQQANLNLGNGTNIIDADTIHAGTGKASGNIQFAGTSGGVLIRDHTGSGRAAIMLGAPSSGSFSGTGQLLLAGHAANIQASIVALGSTFNSGTATGNGTALFTLDNGVIDATSVIMASNWVGKHPTITGTLTIGGNPPNTATLIVNSPSGPGGGIFRISDATVGNASYSGVGNLNIDQNGTADIYTSITNVTSASPNTGNIDITAGTLNMEGATNTIGSSIAPIASFTINGATLDLAENGSTLNADVQSLTVDDTNVFNFSALPPISLLPTVIPIIDYTSYFSDGNSSNLVLGTLPGNYGGYITNISANNTVCLIISSGTVVVKADEWGGGVNNNWDTTTLNWTNNGAAVAYGDGDFVTFDDKAQTNNVNLTAARIPGSLTINNSVLNYTFSGPGNLSGASGLVKNGSGTLLLSETGGDNFAGGILVNGGRLIVDNAGAAITGGLTNESGTIYQIGNNDSHGGIPGGALDDEGTWVFDRTNTETVSVVIPGAGGLTQEGSSTLTLTGASTYTGPTLVTSGTLALSGSGSISSPLTQVQNGTLSISGGSQTETFSTLNFSNGTFNVGAQLASIFTTLGLTNATIIVTPNYNNVGGSAAITTPNLLTGGATNLINVSSIANLTLSATLPFDVPLISYSGGSASFNGGFNFGLVPPAGISGYITNNTANSSVDLVVTVAPQSLTWNGGSPTDNNWSDAANWSGLPIGALDALTFDGLARTNNINNTTAGTDYAGMTFNNTAGPFILNGNPITLSGTMVNNSSLNQTVNLGLDVTAGVTLNASPGNGTLAINGGITNLASAAETVTLEGIGTINDLWSTSPSNQLVLSVGSGANDWVILDGTGNGGLVQAGNLQLALNSSGSAEFDFGASNSAPNLDAGFTNGSQLNIEGTTAIFNMNNGTLKIASATVDSTAATFNLNGGTLLLGGGSGADTFSLVITNGSLYSTNGGNFTIGQRAECTVTLDGGLLDCGTLLFTTGEGSGGIGTIVLNGGTFICTNMLTGTSAANGSGILQFNGGTLEPGSSSSSLFKEENSVPITASVLANAAVINTAGFNTAFNASLISDPSLGGAPDGGLVKLGAGMLTMSAANSYLGNTVISNGTLFVSGSLSNGTVNVVAPGTLAGTGSIGGAVTNNGTLAPGGTATVGTLTVSSNVVLNGTTFMKLNSPSSDELAVTGGGTVTYGGTLSLTNISGAALAAGNSFTLFSAAGYSGSFNSLAPATPGVGLAWNTSNLAVNGTLSIVAVPVFRITSIAINGPALTLKATGGQDGAQFKLLESTNLLLSINQWKPILTNNLDGSGNLNLTTNIVGAHTVDEFYILLQ